MIIPPSFALLAIPEEERENATFIQQNLFALATTVTNLGHAVLLHQWASSQQLEMLKNRDRGNDLWMFKRWSLIGARDGALLIYDFWMVTQAINDLLGRCPTVRDLVDKDKMKVSRKLFEKSFPNIANARLSAAHSNELHAKPEKLEEHLAKGETRVGPIYVADGASVLVSQGLDQNTFMSTIKGSTASYEVDESSTTALRNVALELFQAFKPVKDATIARLRELWQQNSEPPRQG